MVCSLVLYVSAWVMGTMSREKKKKGYRPDQLRSCKVIPALECCQNVASGEAKQDITCLAMC